jgi:hypothetical protein
MWCWYNLNYRHWYVQHIEKYKPYYLSYYYICSLHNINPGKNIQYIENEKLLNDVLGMKIRFIPVYFTNYTNQDVYIKTELLIYFQSFSFQYNLTNQYNTNI